MAFDRDTGTHPLAHWGMAMLVLLLCSIGPLRAQNDTGHWQGVVNGLSDQEVIDRLTDVMIEQNCRLTDTGTNGVWQMVNRTFARNLGIDDQLFSDVRANINIRVGFAVLKMRQTGLVRVRGTGSTNRFDLVNCPQGIVRDQVVFAVDRVDGTVQEGLGDPLSSADAERETLKVMIAALRSVPECTFEIGTDLAERDLRAAVERKVSERLGLSEASSEADRFRLISGMVDGMEALIVDGTATVDREALTVSLTECN